MAFNSRSPPFAGKYAVIISTSGGGVSAHTINTIKRAINSWGMSVIAPGNFKTGVLMKSDEIKRIYNKKLNNITNKIIELLSIKNKYKTKA